MKEPEESTEFQLRRLKECRRVLADDHEPSHHRLAGNQVSILAERSIETAIDLCHGIGHRFEDFPGTQLLDHHLERRNRRKKHLVFKEWRDNVEYASRLFFKRLFQLRQHLKTLLQPIENVPSSPFDFSLSRRIVHDRGAGAIPLVRKALRAITESCGLGAGMKEAA